MSLNANVKRGQIKMYKKCIKQYEEAIKKGEEKILAIATEITDYKTLLENNKQQLSFLEGTTEQSSEEVIEQIIEQVTPSVAVNEEINW